MIKIGRYRIYFTSRHWVQTYGPTRVKKILFMTIYWEARPSDVDKVQQFPLGTPMEQEGRVYRYYRANSNLPKGSKVIEDISVNKENGKGECE